MQTAAVETGPGRGRAFGLISAALVLVAALALRAQHDLGAVDDAFISLRYAQHLSDGQGLVFQPGAPVEGYSNFLLVVLEAACLWLGLGAQTTLTLLGLLPWALVAYMLTVFMVTGALQARPLVAVCTSLAVCAHPIGLVWAVSGLETGLFSALLLAAYLASIAARQPAWRVAALLFLAALTRMEALAFVPLLAWNVRARSADRRALVVFALAFGVSYVTYFVLRQAYFGAWLPNTYHAKLAGGGPQLWRRGLVYVVDFLYASPLFALVMAVAFHCRRSAACITSSLAVLGVLFAISVYEGGDHFAMFRFMVPALPFLGILTAAAAACIAQRFGGPRGIVAAPRKGLALALVLVVAFGNGLFTNAAQVRGEERASTHLQRAAVESFCAREWSDLGRMLREQTPPGTTIATIAVGAVGYYSERYIIDPYGIIDPYIARLERRLGSGRAGHEKFDVEHVLELEPDYLILFNLRTSEPLRAAQLAGAVWGEFNRQVAGDARLAARYELQAIASAAGYWNVHAKRP